MGENDSTIPRLSRQGEIIAGFSVDKNASRACNNLSYRDLNYNDAAFCASYFAHVRSLLFVIL